MTTTTGPWLSEDEVLLQRMETFHRQRVEAVASGGSPVGKRGGGILVVHLIPRSCVQGRQRLDGVKLKEHGGAVPTLGGSGGYSRFNVDGLLKSDGHGEVRTYSQLYRDGRLEAALADVAYPLDRVPKSELCLRDSICEQAVFRTVAGYLRFCRAVGLSPPVCLFSALVGCHGVRICTDFGFRDLSENGVDRTPAYLPEIEIADFDAEPAGLLRPWCDLLWQACGMDQSFNFDQSGNWRQRRG